MLPKYQCGNVTGYCLFRRKSISGKEARTPPVRPAFSSQRTSRRPARNPPAGWTHSCGVGHSFGTRTWRFCWPQRQFFPKTQSSVLLAEWPLSRGAAIRHIPAIGTSCSRSTEFRTWRTHRSPALRLSDQLGSAQSPWQDPGPFYPGSRSSSRNHYDSQNRRTRKIYAVCAGRKQNIAI